MLEYLKGKPLSTLLKTSGFDVQRVVRLAIQLTEALAHAHAHDVIHRDLKPANIFIQPGDHIRVMDFGVALLNTERLVLAERLGRQAQDLERYLGQSPKVAGTPLFMAPEQLLGAEQDARTDIWSLGVVLFRWFTGRMPFNHPVRVVAGDKPSFRDSDDTPASLRRLIESCLQKDVDLRPPNVSAILRKLKELDADQPYSVVEPDTPSITNLKPPSDVFIGRHSEQSSLLALIHRGEQIISVLGTGGCGKTRLVVELALANQHLFDATFFCDLSDARDLVGIAVAVSDALDVPLTHSDPVEQLGFALASLHRVLLILDNFEQVVAHAAESVQRWQRAAPDAVFVVTSRHRLGLDAEVVFNLSPLDSPCGDDFEAISQSEAVKLFVARAAEHVPKFSLTQRNAEDIGALVRTLDGLPLAIELAASRVRVLRPAKMLARISKRFSLLKSARRDLSDRQATLMGTLAWSWDLLTPWEQSALAQASEFEGGFTLEAAEAVIDLEPFEEAPFVVDVIESLIDKSLIRSSNPDLVASSLGEQRFDLLTSVQAFAAEKLVDLGPSWVEATQTRFTYYFASLGEEPPQAQAVLEHPKVSTQALSVERDNLVKASMCGVRLKLPHAACDAVCAAYRVFELKGPLRPGLGHLSYVLTINEIDDRSRMRVLSCRGRLYRYVGDMDAAWSDLEQALALARRLGDRYSESQWRGNLAILSAYGGRPDEAREGFVEALDIASQNNDRRGESLWRGSLAILQSHQGLLADAREGLEHALDISRQVGDLRNECVWLGNLANLDSQEGRQEAARGRFTKAIHIARQLGSRRSEGIWLGNLADLDRRQGHLQDARQGCTQALAIARQLGNRRNEGHWLHILAILDETEGRFEVALLGYQQALEITRSLGDHRIEGILHSDLGPLCRKLGRVDTARQHFTDGEVLLRRVNDPFRLGQILCRRGLLDLDDNRLEEAQAALLEARRHADELNLADDSELMKELRFLADAITMRGMS